MLQPLSKLLHDKKGVQWEEGDVRYFAQKWLRAEMHTPQIYCEDFKRGVMHVRTPSPAVRQAIILSEYNLKSALTQAGGPALRQLKVAE